MSNKGEYVLTNREMNLLLALVQSLRKGANKIFDKKDNCFTNKSFRELEKLTDKSKSSLQRLFQKLESEGLTRTVINVQNEEVLMLKPSFLPCSYSMYETYFKNAMFHLGSHKSACEWASRCRKDYTLYDYTDFCPTKITEINDINTGELIITGVNKIRPLTLLEVKKWNEYIVSESITDRTKRRQSVATAA
ncbi:MarR family transcriptional regulator [Photobacterium ganghwense]|uniref:MarR family transcriptional regulator n=1 Tax=Photobacterium ganghwense TaxID=320778 RepID=UPI001A8D2FCD|nr:MarR family transcriptional regulator [Photobacterium ganghwense]QSV13419.1 MarR family transcriptional regulator [Photobacterium ganghwense]